MAIEPGRRFGSFEVIERLGVGGMGEVYRAHDARLGRDVAIKVLPEGVARDTERLARFDREARALAALSHPNVGGIHGAEEADGVRFLVLELIPGDTLREVLDRGPGLHGVPLIGWPSRSRSGLSSLIGGADRPHLQRAPSHESTQ